jgi:hypothetical protein
MRVLSRFRLSPFGLIAGLLLATAVGFAQSAGWRRVDEPAQNQSGDPSTPVAAPDQAGVPAGPPPAEPPSNYGIPSRLTIPAGKFINVRIEQPLSSDRNQAGDYFSATLSDPIVVDGIVVVQRGQRVSGRISEVDKGGRVSGVAKLRLQVTELTAVDGQQLPVQTEFVSRNAPSTVGRDVGAVAGTTALGAAVGAAAAWGRGAAIGAGAGAALGIAGVLLSRGAPAVVYPETPLTFRIQQAVNVNTERAPQAFQPVNPYEYPQQQPALRTGPGGPPPGAAPYPYPAAPYAYASPYPYPYGCPYPYPYYSPFWGPGFGVVIGPRFYGGGGYYYRGYGGYRGYRR